VGYLADNEELDTLMEFLARYVRVVHCNRFFMNKLFLNKGKSYVEILTPSDIAYAICLLKNGIAMWRHKIANNGDAGDTKPLYSAGEGQKRNHGESVWSKEGIKYFNTALENWNQAFGQGSRDFHVLQLYWKEWIEKEGKTYMIGDDKGMKKKSVHSVLRTREQGETVKGTGRAKKVIQMEDEEDDEDEEVFVCESDDDDNGIVDVGNWSACTRGGRRTVQGGYDNDNDGDDHHPILNQESDDEDNNNDDGSKRERDDEGSEDVGAEEDGCELSGIQQMMEDEAVVAGLTKGRGRRGRVAAATWTSPRRAAVQQSKQPKKRQRFGQVIVNEPTGESQRKNKRGRVPSNKAGFI
jgi:hypothetical protein